METVKIFAKPSFDRAFKKLTAQQQSVVKNAIAKFPESIGKPHLHSGISIRSVGKYLECRAGLQMRVLFYLYEGEVWLATAGNHNDISRYVKEN